MFRSIFSISRKFSYLNPTPNLIQNAKTNITLVSNVFQRNFSLLNTKQPSSFLRPISDLKVEPQRTVTKYSLGKGKRKTVNAVIRRFYRLHWGGWIRRIAGSHKKLWRKTHSRRKRLLEHVLCNATQNRLLDKMVNNYWRKRRYYVNDPYEPYHTREEYYYTATKPRPYFPSEEKN